MKTFLLISLMILSFFAFSADLAWAADASKVGHKTKCCCSAESHQSETKDCSCCSNSDKQDEDSDSKGSCEKDTCHCSVSQYFSFLYNYSFSYFPSFVNFEKVIFPYRQTAPQFVFLDTWQPPKIG